MPIAGVVWQHIHYIVGLQRLGHEVYYVEDTENPCYDPVTVQWGTDFTYAGKTLCKLAEQHGFKNRWCFCHRDLPGHPTAGMSKKVIGLYRDADAIVNICGAQEFNDDILQNERILYMESDPGIEQIRVDQGNRRGIFRGDEGAQEHARPRGRVMGFSRSERIGVRGDDGVGSRGFPPPAPTERGMVAIHGAQTTQPFFSVLGNAREVMPGLENPGYRSAARA